MSRETSNKWVIQLMWVQCGTAYLDGEAEVVDDLEKGAELDDLPPLLARHLRHLLIRSPCPFESMRELEGGLTSR